jgi:hypothetical protein
MTLSAAATSAGGEVRGCAALDDDGIVARLGRNEDEGGAGRQRLVDNHGAGIDPVRRPGRLRHAAKRVAADAGDHPRIAPGPRRRDCLVGALAARPVLEALAQDGLAHQRQSRRPEGKVRDENSEHGNRCARHEVSSL